MCSGCAFCSRNSGARWSSRVLHSRLKRDDAARRRFLREAQLASWFDHPYAAHTYAFGGRVGPSAWIAMELVSGISSRSGWRRTGRYRSRSSCHFRATRLGGPGRARSRARTSRPEAVERDGARERGPSDSQATRPRDRRGAAQRCPPAAVDLTRGARCWYRDGANASRRYQVSRGSPWQRTGAGIGL